MTDTDLVDSTLREEVKSLNIQSGTLPSKGKALPGESKHPKELERLLVHSILRLRCRGIAETRSTGRPK